MRPQTFWNLFSLTVGNQKGTAITLTEKKKIRWIKAASGIAAALMITIGGIWGYGEYQGQNTVASTISLDVNPSIETGQ